MIKLDMRTLNQTGSEWLKRRLILDWPLSEQYILELFGVQRMETKSNKHKRKKKKKIILSANNSQE